MTQRRNEIELRRGDIFLSRNPMMLGRVINFVQAFYARDKKARFSHSGIILDPNGTTLEALWRVSSQNLFEAYAGQEVLIGRPKALDEWDIEDGLQAISHHKGQRYPFHRIFMFLIPPLVRRFVWDRIVCSELVCKYLNKAGLEDLVWIGKVPDDVDEMITYHKDFDIIFEGNLPEVK